MIPSETTDWNGMMYNATGTAMLVRGLSCRKFIGKRATGFVESDAKARREIETTRPWKNHKNEYCQETRRRNCLLAGE